MMSIRASGASDFLFGRSRRISLRIIVAGVLVSIGVGFIGQIVPLGAIVIYRSDIAGILAGAVFLGGAAAIAYFNSGYIVVVVSQAILLFGLFTSGGVAGYVGASMIESLRLMIRFAIGIAIAFSTIGYIIGVFTRNILRNNS
jgi:hypothetical protein